METEYCNKCGLLHDPEDGECLGCKLVQQLAETKEKLEIATQFITTVKDFTDHPMLELGCDETLEKIKE